MAYDFEMLQSIGAIYKYAFENPNTHRNTMRKYLLSKGKRRIAIVGATGKREDHTIGNVSLLMELVSPPMKFIPIQNATRS